MITKYYSKKQLYVAAGLSRTTFYRKLQEIQPELNAMGVKLKLARRRRLRGRVKEKRSKKEKINAGGGGKLYTPIIPYEPLPPPP